jgi:signal transduction histidine kinase
MTARTLRQGGPALPPESPARITIVICDDESSTRQLACAALAGGNYSLIEAVDGNEAVELARSVRPDLMVIDMMMPGRNGLDVVAELRTDPEFADMPAILLTAHDAISHRDAAADAGADRFMTKPFSPLKLASVVDGLIRKRLAAQNKRLRELDRLKDEFIALVSHELRTPLTSIGGYLELILEEEVGELTPQQRRFIEVIERNAQRLLRLVGDLLLVAQIEAGKLELDLGVVDLAKLAAEAVETARPRADQKGIKLSLVCGDEPALACDPARLAQAMDNLISNGVKFTPEGGHVEVRVSCRQGRAVIEVEDSGIGIAPAERDAIFAPFFRASNAVEREIQGTGLGLVITKAIVLAHRGEIHVESEEGIGTTLRVELPLEHNEHKEGNGSSPAAGGAT